MFEQTPAMSNLPLSAFCALLADLLSTFVTLADIATVRGLRLWFYFHKIAFWCL